MEELIPIFFMFTVAGVLILRPISKKLGILLEAFAKERIAGTQARAPRELDEAQLVRLTAALERLNSRLDLIDDRVHFVEQLIDERPRRQRLTG